MKPPREIDGAEVLFWAWSFPQPFFEMPASDHSSSVPIHGLAVCRYRAGEVYRFSCNASWETENDTDCATPDEALVAPSAQYDVTSVKWQPW